MKVSVHSTYTNQTWEFAGTKHHVFEELMEAFPWLHTGHIEHHGDVEDVVLQLNGSQAFEAEVQPDGASLAKSTEPDSKESFEYNQDGNKESSTAIDMLGWNPLVHPAFAAAKFLAGRREVPMEQVRLALRQHHDKVDAALVAYGFPPEDHMRSAIKAVMSLNQMHKSMETQQVVHAQDIEPGTPAAQETAEALKRAYKENDVKVAHLDGKHSKGSFIARDAAGGGVWLLKPGANGPGPAAGAKEDPVTQSRREAAFWTIADSWGLGESVPRCDLVIIDGKEYAAIRMLPFDWVGLQRRIEEAGVAKVLPAFDAYRMKGFCHRWAVLDFVLGNPDRHGDNMMVSPDNKLLALIDHGSAFAGPAFDPAHDENSFVPFYLRAWSADTFNTMTVEQKLAAMPKVGRRVQEELKDWLNSLDITLLEGTLTRFGVEPGPTTSRLARLRELASSMPVDDAINRLWVTV